MSTQAYKPQTKFVERKREDQRHGYVEDNGRENENDRSLERTPEPGIKESLNVVLQTDKCPVVEHVRFVRGQYNTASDRITENTQNRGKTRNCENMRHWLLDEFRNPIANGNDVRFLKRRTHSVSAVHCSRNGSDPLRS